MKRRRCDVQAVRIPDIRFRLWMLFAFKQWGIALVHNETKEARP